MTAGDNGDKRDQIDYWAERLTEREMPVFAHTARVISAEAGRSDKSASELAKLVLQDASMTTRLLRIANSIYHNPGRGSISTVSRAIVVLGFEAVRNICFSIAVIDALSQGSHKERVVSEMARSFHAAEQARTFAIQRKDESPEEVFVATLLYHLGRMAFWCFAESIDPEAAQRLDAALAKNHRPSEEIEREVLGFSMRDLTVALNRKWHLSALLKTALEPERESDPRTSNIRFGLELASTVEDGWDDPKVKAMLSRLAESLYLPIDKITQMVHDNAKEAVVAMSRLGAAKASKLIPLPQSCAEAAPKKTAQEHEPVHQFNEPDRELQLKILSELSQMLEEQPNINLVLEMVLEGIYRGVGMDRVLFALLTPDRQALRAKFTLGWDREQMNQQFRFHLNPQPQHVFDKVIQSQEAAWIDAPRKGELGRLVTEEITAVVGEVPFFVMPIGMNGKTIGLFYADRKPSKRPLNEDSFANFRLFCQQARLGLAYLKKR